MGGRGYIQWRSAQMERHKTGHLAQINNSDAYLVIWDHKLWGLEADTQSIIHRISDQYPEYLSEDTESQKT